MTERRDWGQPPRYPQRDDGRYQPPDHGRYEPQNPAPYLPQEPAPYQPQEPAPYRPQNPAPYQPREPAPYQPRDRQYPQDQPWQPQPFDHPQDRPWHPQPYDPVAHKQRISGPQQSRTSQEHPWPQPEDEQHPYPWESQPGQQPGRQPGGDPRRADKRPVRHKVLIGLLALGVLVIIGGIVKVARDTQAPAAETMTAAAAPSCPGQLNSWIAAGGKERTSVLSGDLSTLGRASGKLTASKSPAAIAAVRTAAAAVRSGATAVRADPGPSCVRGMRKDLLAAARDYSQAAADATSGMSQLTAGNEAKASTDTEAASTASRRGNAKLRAALKAATAYSAG